MEFFGKAVAHIYAIELQKRGLPRAHIRIVLDTKITTAAQVDPFVRAEVPPTFGRLQHIVLKQMTHRCDKDRCLQDGACSKGFPHAFEPETTWKEDDKHPTYRRRSLQQGGFVMWQVAAGSRPARWLDNSWVTSGWFRTTRIAT